MSGNILIYVVDKTIGAESLRKDLNFYYAACWREYVRNREGNFLGFEFLMRNEEIGGHSHEERGIFKQSFRPIFTI